MEKRNYTEALKLLQEGDEKYFSAPVEAKTPPEGGVFVNGFRRGPSQEGRAPEAAAADGALDQASALAMRSSTFSRPMRQSVRSICGVRSATHTQTRSGVARTFIGTPRSAITS